MLQKLTRVSDIDLAALQQRIQKLVPRGTRPLECDLCMASDQHSTGGTDLNLALQSSAAQLGADCRPEPNLEKRVFLLTDMIVSPSDTSLMECVPLHIRCAHTDSFESLMRRQSDQQVYTTFVGVGTSLARSHAPSDSHHSGASFNVELANVITRVKGCTYLSVTTEKEFKKVMTDR